MRQFFGHTLLLWLCFVFSGTLTGQELSGIVIDGKAKKVVPNTHVINKSTLKGTLTNENGRFSIKLTWGDTIVFSNIAYQYFYFIYQDSASELTDVLVELKEQNYLLSEVSIFSYELTTNKDREIVLSKPLLPSSQDLSDGTIQRAGVQNPAEFLYNLFGSKPRQLKMLAQLKAEDAYRLKLDESNNRSRVVELTGLSQEELEAFMFYCKFASVYMSTMNDYQFLISVKYCFQEYVKERELEEFLEQFD